MLLNGPASKAARAEARSQKEEPRRRGGLLSPSSPRHESHGARRTTSRGPARTGLGRGRNPVAHARPGGPGGAVAHLLAGGLLLGGPGRGAAEARLDLLLPLPHLAQLLAQAHRLGALSVELALKPLAQVGHLGLHVLGQRAHLAQCGGIGLVELLKQFRMLPVELGQRHLALELPDLLGLLAHAGLSFSLLVVAGQPAADGLAAGVAEGASRHGGSDLAEVVGDEGEEGHVGLLVEAGRNFPSSCADTHCAPSISDAASVDGRVSLAGLEHQLDVCVEAAQDDVRPFLHAAHKKPDVQQQAALRQAGLYRVKAQPAGSGHLPGQLVVTGHGLGEGQAEGLGLLERYRPEKAAVPDGAGGRFQGVLRAAHARRA